MRRPPHAIRIYKTLFLIINTVALRFSLFVALGGAVLVEIILPYLLHFSIGYRGPVMERVLAAGAFTCGSAYITLAAKACGHIFLHSRSLIEAWKVEYVRHLSILCYKQREQQEREEPGPRWRTTTAATDATAERARVIARARLNISQLERRIALTLRPIQIHAASVYKLNERSVLKLWDVVANNTILLACTFPFRPRDS